MPTQVTWPSGSTNATPTVYSIPNAGEVNWPTLTNFLVALGNGAQSTTSQRYAVRVALSTPVTVSVNDCVISVDKTVPGVTVVNLPNGVDKAIFYITDGAGDAKTNNITILPSGIDTIDGQVSFVMDGNSQGVILAYNAANSNWIIVVDSLPDGNNISGFTPDKAIVSDASGFLTSATASSVEVGYLVGVTSSIQTQLNAKQATGNYITNLTGDVSATGPGVATASIIATTNGSFTSLTALTTASNLNSVGTITTGTWNATAVAIIHGGTGIINQVKGSIIAGTGVNTSALLAVGADGTVLTAASGQATGLTWSSPLLNPMTTVGDIIVGGVAGAPSRLGIGATGTVLKGGTTPSYASIVNADIGSSAAIVVTKLANGSANQVLYTNAAGTATAWQTPTSPTVQKFTSGSGTYTTPANVRYLKVVMVGAGGGGWGSGSTGGTAPTAGGASTFGTTLLAANGGGVGSAFNREGGAGGTASLGTGPIGAAVSGGSGTGTSYSAITTTGGSGGAGGTGIFGGGGGGGRDGAAGLAAATNSGAGGGGGGGNDGFAGINTGPGGGAGGSIDALITTVLSTYAYAVGAAGGAGVGGTNGFAGGAGGAGQIIVYEYY